MRRAQCSRSCVRGPSENAAVQESRSGFSPDHESFVSHFLSFRFFLSTLLKYTLDHSTFLPWSCQWLHTVLKVTAKSSHQSKFSYNPAFFTPVTSWPLLSPSSLCSTAPWPPLTISACIYLKASLPAMLCPQLLRGTLPYLLGYICVFVKSSFLT